MSTSRIPGFYTLSVNERRERLRELCDLSQEDFQVLDDGGLDTETCDNMIENVIGRYSLPMAVGLNFHINGQDQILPMVVEEPSVVAAASNAARMIRDGGGFQCEVSEPIMISQVQLCQVADPKSAAQNVEAHKPEILALASEHSGGLIARGGGPVDMVVRQLSGPKDPDGGMLVVHLHVNVCDAMGANLVNTIAEAVAPRLAELAEARIGLRILSNLATHRTVRVQVKVPQQSLSSENHAEVLQAIVSASRFAELDPYRAATHNKGIMNGIDAVIMATANDWRSIEAGAHAYAAHPQGYRPLAIWRQEGDFLMGDMTLPMAVGTVGGALQVHRAAKLGLKILGSGKAADLAQAAACAGMANNLAALRALATVGIQKGHMALHARIVAKAKARDSQSATGANTKNNSEKPL